MKVLVVPDLHFRQYLCGVDLLWSDNGADLGPEFQTRSFWGLIADEIADVVRRESVKAIVFLGDMFHHWQPTPREIVACRDFVETICDSFGWHDEHGPSPCTFIISGNHDYGRNRNNAAELFGDLANVITGPECWSFIRGPKGAKTGFHKVGLEGRPHHDTAFAFLPYPNKISGVWAEAASKSDANWQTSAGLSVVVQGLLADALPFEPEGGRLALFSHVTFQNSVYSPGQPVPLTDVAVSTETFGSWTQVFGGHIHLPQDLGENARYVGAVTPQNFGDNFRGRVMVWDIEDNAVQPFELENGAKFITLEPGQLPPLDSPRFTFTRWKGEVGSAAELAELRQQWKSANITGKFEVSVRINESNRTFEAAASTSVNDVFAAYLSARPDAVPAELEQPVREFLTTLLDGGNQ